ncbi:alpha/beta fold hydrolase [Prosthecobacter vanneervenii]|uniref:Pimeloyl-ACP methyl ester carboxylesterase n=1 Tax=Prosthecobacter vanneervenii TaxID=48466 RepID=A0A7W7YB38_9BACT|nr:alpha/beta fold hydrolase [Prosthecobacter vanneervenii]MBB5032830.1 pimeloyl-ACP methyl ester carboxylesterase [Prosthecobacter vanneervenii]
MSEFTCPTSTVVLIHGLGRSPRSMWLVGLWLKFCGYRVKSIGYPSHRSSIADAVQNHINPALARLEIEEGAKVHFVTHSLGGIVFRAWAAQRDSSFPLGRAVLLAPPNQGSQIIDELRQWGWVRWLLGPVSAELGTDANSTPNMLGPLPPETGVIMGNKDTLPIFRRFLGDESDGVVTIASSHGEGEAEHVLLPTNHATIILQPAVFRAVHRFLKTGSFAEA